MGKARKVVATTCSSLRRKFQRMFHFRHDQLAEDFLSMLFLNGLDHVIEEILSYLDVTTLVMCEKVSKRWLFLMIHCKVWKRMIERRTKCEEDWKGVYEMHGWSTRMLEAPTSSKFKEYLHFRDLCNELLQKTGRLELFWHHAEYGATKIRVESGVESLSYDDHIIVAGLEDGTLNIFDRNSLLLTGVLFGHEAQVLCLQFDDRFIISGSRDKTVRVWARDSYDNITTLTGHRHAVNQLKFNEDMLVTCSNDGKVIVWDILSPTNITIRRMLVHLSRLNCIDFDKKYIITGASDCLIYVWDNKPQGGWVRVLDGHQKSVTCLQYDGRILITGSADRQIRIWNVEKDTCLEILRDHRTEIVALQFREKLLVGLTVDGRALNWRLPLDPDRTYTTGRPPNGKLSCFQMDCFTMIGGSRENKAIYIYDYYSSNRD